MKFSVKVKTNQKTQELKFVSNQECIVRLKSLPIEGKANQELISLFSEHFKIPKKEIKIVSGEHSKIKWIEIPLTD
ncbi:DUF167 domain-containing protein (plasmid) [Leptospira sp. WS60.C2]